MNTHLNLVRALLSEIRIASSEKMAKNNVMMTHILKQTEMHKETSEVLCKAREELKNLTENYLCYLNSLRRYKEIQTMYAGKGERSIRETANLVGFKLPHDPK